MATLVGYTSIKLTDQEASALVARIGEEVVSALNLAPNLKDVTINVVPEAFRTPKPYGLISFFAYTAPNKPLEAKRALVSAVQDAVSDFFAGRMEVRTVVIIKEHADENVGVGGVLRADAKKIAK